MRRVRLLLPGLLLLVVAGSAHAEAPPVPPYFAIENVRVVAGDGRVIEGANVLVADGLIEAVGKGVRIPDDCWVIDGEGLSLYPGLIDALGSMGLKAPEEERGGGFGAGPPSDPVRGPEDRPQTTPGRSAATELVDDDKFEKWRKAGFTAVLTAPGEGIFAGLAALVSTGAAEPAARVIAADVAQRVQFPSGGFRDYPGSLMGVLSYVEQTMLDARHHAAVAADYAKDPRGLERPGFDAALDPLVDALERGTPFLMPGQLPRQIDRALVLKQRLDLPVIVVGAQGAYDRAAQMKAAGASAIVDLNWPKAPKDRDPDARTAVRTLIHRELAPTTPAALAEAGVPFAFTGGSTGSPSDYFEGVRKAIEKGLAPEDALRALSSGAASLLGVENRLGTVARGKIANLVLASDWPWAEDVEVKAVFVDGRRYQEREDDTPKEAPASDVSGTWSLSMTTPRGARDMTAELTMDDDGQVKGKIVSEMGDTTVDEGRMSADRLSFETTREFGGRSMTATWSLTVEGEKLSGSTSAGPMVMDVSGERTAMAASETKETEAETPTVSADELRSVLRAVQGPARRMGDFAITNAQVWTVSGETLENGTVVVRDGKIRAVGRNVDVPGGIEVIDAQGGALIPGIIDCHSHIAIEGGVNEGSLAVTSMVTIADVVNPDDISIYRALAGGVTAANLLHGSANPIGGRNQVVKLRWGSDAEGMKFEGAPPGIKFALGENPKRSNFRSDRIPDRYPQTRMGVMDVIRQAFTDARAYRAEWQAWEKNRKRPDGLVRPRPRRDLELEALVEILEGERLVHSHCYRADEILQLMRVAEEFDFRVATLQHVLEGYKVADEIAAHGAGASTFSDWWGYKVEAYEAIPHNAALMAERGVVVSINSDSPEEMRHLNQEAAKAVKWGGMSEIEALKMVTLNPAKQLRVDDRVGSIEVGKDADLVLYDGHPLAITSVVQKTFVDGDLYFDLEADRERQSTLEALVEKLEGSGSGDESKDDGSSPEIRWRDEFQYTCRGEH